MAVIDIGGGKPNPIPTSTYKPSTSGANTPTSNGSTSTNTSSTSTNQAKSADSKQNYISFIDKVRANIKSGYESIQEEFKKSTSTIARLALDLNTSNKTKNSLLGLATVTHLASSTIATVANCAVSIASDALGNLIPENIKTTAKQVATSIYNSNGAKLAIGLAGIALGVGVTVLTGGAALPALAAGLKTAGIAAAIGASVSGLDYIGSATINNSEIKSSELLDVTISGATSGFMAGGVAYGVTSTVNAVKTSKTSKTSNIKKSKDDYIKNNTDIDYIAEAKKTDPKHHGNSLENTRTNFGYEIKENGTGKTLKYGETLDPRNRYSISYYENNNAYMEIQTYGTKVSVHNWQHEMNINYKNTFGKFPENNIKGW